MNKDLNIRKIEAKFQELIGFDEKQPSQAGR